MGCAKFKGRKDLLGARALGQDTHPFMFAEYLRATHQWWELRIQFGAQRDQFLFLLELPV